MNSTTFGRCDTVRSVRPSCVRLSSVHRPQRQSPLAYPSGSMMPLAPVGMRIGQRDGERLVDRGAQQRAIGGEVLRLARGRVGPGEQHRRLVGWTESIDRR